MTEHGFYVITDQFFEDFPDKYLKGNKNENRPHYFAIQDKRTGLYWFIPMSSRIEKYKKIVESREKRKRACDILHIAKLDNGKESAFLIQDMFPVSPEYVKREYTIAGNHLRVTSENLAKTIDTKAKRILALIRKMVPLSHTQPDVLKIETELLKRLAGHTE